MKISGTGSNYQQSPALLKANTQNEDGVSKNIRSRIDDLQKQLEKLSENEDMDPKERLKRKEELNQQITELNTQLTQHEQEKKQEAAQPKSERNYDRFERSSTEESAADSMNTAISADVSLQQAATRGSAARSLHGKANVLESEIRQDGSRGVATERKQKELADLRARERRASAAQNEELSKAAKKSAQVSKTTAGLEYLQALKDKIPGTAFFVGTVSYGQTYGNSADNNFVINPKYLEKLDDPEERKSFEETVKALNSFSNQFRASQAARGREVISEGWFCDEDGNWGGWTVTRSTNQRSHLQEMREEADKINEKKAERKKQQEELDEKRAAEKQAEQELNEKLKTALGSKFLGMEIRSEY